VRAGESPLLTSNRERREVDSDQRDRTSTERLEQSRP